MVDDGEADGVLPAQRVGAQALEPPLGRPAAGAVVGPGPVRVVQAVLGQQPCGQGQEYHTDRRARPRQLPQRPVVDRSSRRDLEPALLPEQDLAKPPGNAERQDAGCPPVSGGTIVDRVQYSGAHARPLGTSTPTTQVVPMEHSGSPWGPQTPLLYRSRS